jgi:dihydrofolate reductase
MKVSHIVAMSSNRAIGRNGGMPWHIPKDFRFFKETTMGHAMIMGRKTWESIGKALPGRKTIVVTRSQDLKVPSEVLVMTSVEAALSWCRDNQTTWGDECFIVGGGDIYRQTISKADRIYLTEVHKVIDDGDTFYPPIPDDAFRKVRSDAHPDEPIPFTFTTWDRV